MNVTPIYQLGYFVPNMVIGSNLDLDKNRFTTIENQLYNIYNIFGNGVIAQYDASGAKISSWNLSPSPNSNAVQVSSGKGHIAYVYCATIAPVDVLLTLPAGATQQSFYVYATKTTTSPVDESCSFIASLTVIDDPVNYIGLGIANLTLNSDGSYTVGVDQTQNRQEISLYGSLTTLVKNHLHIGGANNPSPIDLSKHVKGFLSSDYIDQIDLSKVTKGTLDPNRLPTIDHNTLANIGTLTHSQIDSLLAALQSSSQYPGFNYKLSDYGIVNRLQIILALKRQTGFFNIDGEQVNSIFYAPYTSLNNFVDLLNTSAIIDTNVHRIFGATGSARQSNVIKVNTSQQFQAALSYDQNNVVNPNVYNVTVSGISTDFLAGSINAPYAIAGSANTIYVASFTDNYVSMFDYAGNFIKRSKSLDAVYNLPLSSPSGLYYDSSQNYLYIADTFNHRIIVTDGNLNTVALVGNSNGTTPGSGIPGGYYKNNFVSGFSYPKGVYGFGNTFYVSDSGNNQIQKFHWIISGSNVSYQLDNVYKYPTNFLPAYSPITGLNAPLSDPRGLIATSYNNTNYLYVADFYNHRILCGIETNGSYSVNQILALNSGGNGFTTNLLMPYVFKASSVVGAGATFIFGLSVDKNIFSIGVSNSGLNYSDGDRFYINYPGFQTNQQYFSVLTDGLGHITTAYVDYGISTNGNIGFNHPSSLALNIKSNRIDLLISDTENNRVVNYHGFIGVGLGTTNNKLSYTYSLGTQGYLSDTSSLVYFNNPIGIYSPTGFTTLLVADSLNNRIHSISTNFASNSISGLGTFVFGFPDPGISTGGVVLQKPIAYSTISTSFVSSTQPNSNWYFGDINTPNSIYQYSTGQRYNFSIINQQTLQNQDQIALAFNTINEDFKKTSFNLGAIGCYFVLSSGGTSIQFEESNYSSYNIGISSVYTLRTSTSTNTSFEQTIPLSSFGLSSSTGIIGFGFVWNLSIQPEQVQWKLNSYSNTNLQTSFPQVAQQRVVLGATNDAIFLFNSGKYYTQGTYLYRFDTGASSATHFDFVTFYYSLNNESIKFSYRANDNINTLNNTQSASFSSAVISGGLIPLNASSRYIDFQFDYLSDQLNTPSLTGIVLYYSTNSAFSGIIYDTNVTNPTPGAYPRFRWDQGSYQNISVLPVSNSLNQQYQITIADASRVSLFNYLNSYTIELSDLINNSTSEQTLIDGQNLYLSPWQVFSQYPPQRGLLNPLYFTTDNASGYYIADTDNDRLLHINSSGAFVKSIQGTVKLSRTQRDFVLLNCFYNPQNQYLFVLFSQYFAPSSTYLSNLAVSINGENYNCSDSVYFNANYSGKYSVNSNNQSCVFYIQATAQMDTIIQNYSFVSNLIINNPTTTFTIDPNGAYDTSTIPQGPENYSVTSNTNTYPEFVPNLQLGVGTVLLGVSTTVQNFNDPIYFHTNTSGVINSTLISYNSSSTTSFTIPIEVKKVFFQNIFKPLYVDSSNLNCVVLSCVGNYPIRCFDTNFNQLYKVTTPFNFNEQLGGGASVLDTSNSIPDVLLISQVGSASTIIGVLSIYKVSTNTILNSYTYSGFDVVQGIQKDSNYGIILYDRQASGLRSKLLEINQDGTPVSSVNNVFNKPVSLQVRENGLYYVTDNKGPLGAIFDRTFIGDMA